MATPPGKFPFGWNRTTTSVTAQQAKSPLTSGPTTIPIAVYKDIFSGSPEIVITETTGGKTISFDGSGLVTGTLPSSVILKTVSDEFLEVDKINLLNYDVTSIKLPPTSGVLNKFLWIKNYGDNNTVTVTASDGDFIDAATTLTFGGTDNESELDGAILYADINQWYVVVKYHSNHESRIAALENIRVSSFVALADSNETITKAQGLRRIISTLTAHRSKTISKSGAVEGDMITVYRANYAAYDLRIVDPDAGPLFTLNAPGRATFRLEGGDGSAGTWHLESSSLSNGSAVVNLLDFGAVGDGVVDDSAALQAFFDVLSLEAIYTTHVNIRFGFIPRGTYKFNTPLVLKGNNANTTGFVLVGEGSATQAIGGAHLVYAGGATLAALSVIGVSGSRIEGISIDGGGTATYPCLVTVDSAIDGSSFSTVMERCTFYNPISTSGAALGVGPTTPGTSDVNQWTFRDCLFFGNPASWTSTSYTSHAVHLRRSDNVIDIRFERCCMSYAMSGIVNNVGSQLLVSDGCNFNLLREWMLVDNGIGSSHRNGYSEGCGGFIAGTGGNVLLENFRVNLICSDKTYPSILKSENGQTIYHPNVTIRGGYFAEYRQRRSITNIDTTTDVVSVTASEVGTHPLQSDLAVDQPFFIWADDGSYAMPQASNYSIGYNIPLYIKTLTNISGDTWNITFAGSPGGATINFAYSGSGVLRLYTPIRVESPNFSAQLVSFDAMPPGSPNVYPTPAFPVSDSTQFPFAPSPSTATFRQCSNGTHVNLYKMPDVDAGHTTNPSFGPSALYGQQQEEIIPGIDAMKTSIVRVRADKLAINATAVGMPTSFTAGAYVWIPGRTRIIGMYLDIEQAFAGPSLGSAIFEIHEDGAAAEDLFKNCSLMATAGTIYGNADAELGTKLQRANAVQGGYAPANFGSAISWPCYWTITTTGCYISQLTAGKFNLYLRLEHLPKPIKVRGFELVS